MNSGLQRGQLPKPVQQRAQHPEGRRCTGNRFRILLVQNPHMTKQTCHTWIHVSLLLDRVVSVTSSSADSNLNSALLESRRGDEFQQETFNLVMRLKSHTQMQAPCVTQVPQGHPQQQHLQHSQQHFQQTFTQPHAAAQQQIQGQGPHLNMQSQHHMPSMSAPQ